MTVHQFLYHNQHDGQYINRMICLSLSIVSLPGLRVNIILTCLQAVGMYPLARQAVNIQRRCLLVAQFLAAVVQAQFSQFQLT